jgi:phasin family protein
MDNRDTNQPFNKAAEAGRNAADEATRTVHAAAREATDAGEHMLHASIEAGQQSAGAAQAAMSTGLNTAAQSFQRATDQITQVIGFGGPQFEEMARQSSQNVEAMTQANTVLVRGAQDISREWLELAQSRLQRNLDGFNALSRSRSLQEFAAAHTDLVRDNMQQVIDTSRRVADVSMRVANEAARTVANRRAA